MILKYFYPVRGVLCICWGVRGSLLVVLMGWGEAGVARNICEPNDNIFKCFYLSLGLFSHLLGCWGAE